MLSRGRTSFNTGTVDIIRYIEDRKSVMKAKEAVAVKRNLDILDNVEWLSKGTELTQSSRVESSRVCLACSYYTKANFLTISGYHRWIYGALRLNR